MLRSWWKKSLSWPMRQWTDLMPHWWSQAWMEDAEGCIGQTILVRKIATRVPPSCYWYPLMPSALHACWYWDVSDLVVGLLVFTQMGHGYDMYDSYQRSISIPNIAKQGSKNKKINCHQQKRGQFLFRFSLAVRCRCGAQEQAERHDTDSTCATGLQLRVETYLQESLSCPGFLSWQSLDV